MFVCDPSPALSAGRKAGKKCPEIIVCLFVTVLSWQKLTNVYVVAIVMGSWVVSAKRTPQSGSIMPIRRACSPADPEAKGRRTEWGSNCGSRHWKPGLRQQLCEALVFDLERQPPAASCSRSGKAVSKSPGMLSRTQEGRRTAGLRRLVASSMLPREICAPGNPGVVYCAAARQRLVRLQGIPATGPRSGF